MPRKIQTAIETPDGYAWPVQPRMNMPIAVVAKAMALAHGRPDVVGESGRRVIGKDNIRPAVMKLIEDRVMGTEIEPEVPGAVLCLWARWLVDREVFPAVAIEESPDLDCSPAV